MNKIFSWFIEPIMEAISVFRPPVFIGVVVIIALASIDLFIKRGPPGLAILIITELVTLWFAGVMLGMFDRSDRP